MSYRSKKFFTPCRAKAATSAVRQCSAGSPVAISGPGGKPIEHLDHRLLDEVPGLGIPTLENLCAFIAQFAAMSDFRLSRVSVWRDGIGDRCDLRFARTLPFQV